MIFSCIKDTIKIFINILYSILLADIVIEATEGSISNVLLYAVVIIIIKLSEFALCTVTDTVLLKSKSKKNHICMLQFYKIFFHRPLCDLSSLKLGDTKEKLNDDFNSLTKKYTSSYPQAIAVSISAIAYSVYLFSLNRWIALLLICISFLQILPPILIKNFLQNNYDDCRDIEAKLTDFTVDGYRGFLLIKLYGLQSWWKKKLAGYHREYSRIGRRSIYTGTAESVLNELVSSILTYITYGVIGLFVLRQLAPLDTGIQAIAISGSFFSAVNASFSVIKDLAISRTAEKRLSNMLSDYSESVHCISRGLIEVSNLSYSYDENKLFASLSLSVDSSKITLIKGENGSGKSTLLCLIAGILESRTGEITIDGYTPLNISGNNYPEKIFFLPQEDAIFNFTASELYSMAVPEQKDIAIELAKRFYLSEEILSHSKIGDLSGGERKKVFLSLAFAVNPPVMMLDEPTNSLDTEGKTVLKELLIARTGGAIIVTHDSLLDDIADYTFFVNKGDNNERS